MQKQSKAKITHLRVSPRKIRLVCDLVRGKNVQDAIDLLKFTNRGCSKSLMKLIESALSNANNKGGFNIDKLYINQLYADQGPALKRSLPRARGSASPILKRTSHVTVVLSEK